MSHEGSPVVAGVVTAVVGTSSSFVVVLAGLTAVGASHEQAASGFLTLLVTQALGMLWLSVRHRAPITLAWSTPGAALLISTGVVTGGWPAAVGAFVVTGVLIVLTGLVPALGDLVSRIPTSLARAMLAGVLVPICLAPVTGLADSPAYVGPVVLAWLVMQLVSRRWAVPVALVVALAVVVVSAGSSIDSGDLVPSLTWTTPHWTAPALVSIAVPLYVVTMASQNVPGVAIAGSFGYQVPWRESMSVTGVGTIVGAPFGGHAINLAAITAALTAGPSAGPDRSRRWIAAVTASVTYLVLALCCAALTALVAAAPGDVMQAAAGLALLGTLAASLAGALAEEDGREAAAVCFLVAASGVTVLGVGAAFWALVAGLVLRPLTTSPRRRSSARSTAAPAPSGTHRR
jgi:benzoate membrane transport protein